VEVDEGRDVDEANTGVVGGDHTILEAFKSWFDGIAIFRTTSNVVRHWICKRAPLRYAT